MALITDLFGKASIDTDYAQATTVKTARTPSETVLAAFDLSKFSPDTPVFFVTYQKEIDPTTNEVTIVNQTSWKGIVNPDINTLTNLELAPGYNDIGNEVGDYVECIPTSFWGNSLVDGIQTSLNPDGTLKLDQAMIQLINDATTPVATRREYFGTKATFDVDAARFGWLFMEKDLAYTKATYQRLYDHLVAVDAASVKDAAGATFKFADKFFGTTGVGLDSSQTEFNTLGKNTGAKTHTLTISQMPSHNHTFTENSGWANNAGGSLESPTIGTQTNSSNPFSSGSRGGGGAHNNIQPSLTISYIIKA